MNFRLFLLILLASLIIFWAVTSIQQVYVTKELEEEEASLEAIDDEYGLVIDDIENSLGGDFKLLYHHGDYAEEFPSREALVTVNSYLIGRLDNLRDDVPVSYDYNQEGRILIAHVTIENKTEELISYPPYFSLSTPLEERPVLTIDRYLEREDLYLYSHLRDDNFSIDKNESLSTYIVYELDELFLNNIEKAKIATIEIPHGRFTKLKDDPEGRFGEYGFYPVVMNDRDKAALDEHLTFYKDRFTKENLGAKKLIAEEKNMDQEKVIADSLVTLKGYQMAEFSLYKEVHKRLNFEFRKKDFYILTLNLQIKNNEAVEIYPSTGLEALYFDYSEEDLFDGYFNSDYGFITSLKPGEEENLFLAFVLDRKGYEQFMNEKEFHFEYGPLVEVDSFEFLSEEFVTFTIPLK